MKNFAIALTEYFESLRPPESLPPGFEVLFPLGDPEVRKLVARFFKKFFNDPHPRRLILGINPGRLGAGITGVNFTAPRQLQEACGIPHSFKPSSELSAEFIYEVIHRYGGVKKFYRQWFIGSVCPLGFTYGGKNINYYDDKKLQAAVTPFIIDKIRKQVSLGFQTDYCLCLGGEKNYQYLCGLNREHNWFDRIEPLPHPRFILQYRRRQKEIFIQKYLSALEQAG